MSEWFENFSDGIESDAGALAAMGGLAHLKNQNAQRNELLKQRELLQEQLASTKAAERTEKQRLEIEQKRFELEQKERNLLQQKASSVKTTRKVMSSISFELDQLENLLG